MTISTEATFNSKPHYPILDGLRGVAAMAVVIFHFMEMVITDYTKNFIGHGYLAVDFFFCLSGFVIAYAYDDRIQSMGFKEFIKSRLIRLHPLVILGTILGLLGFLFDPFVNQSANYDFLTIAILGISSVLIIPNGAMAERGFNLFGLNAPAWSLFWEYVANIAYAFFLYRIKNCFLVILTIIGSFAIIYVAHNVGHLQGGWGKANFWDGCARVSYSFLAGILIWRLKLILKNGIGFLGLAILLSIPFLMPFYKFNWMVESIVVIFYFPLLVSLGAGSLLSERLKTLCNFSGDISYPLYMTHYFCVWVFTNYFLTYKPETKELYIIMIGSILFTVGFAYLCWKYFDTPIRKYFNRKRKQKAGLIN
jgi:peptidoglycan/LPS O-acetylase OafA/YrhL